MVGVRDLQRHLVKIRDTCPPEFKLVLSRRTSKGSGDDPEAYQSSMWLGRKQQEHQLKATIEILKRQHLPAPGCAPPGSSGVPKGVHGLMELKSLLLSVQGKESRSFL